MMARMSEDCLFENTAPAPDGERFSGQVAVRDFWERFFDGSARAAIEPEQVLAWGERAVLRWVYRWVDAGGKEGRIRGMDLYHFREGLITEKLSYVKG
jgi:ketosteroid isomerase-like protein